jgi:hypothetical protein
MSLPLIMWHPTWPWKETLTALTINVVKICGFRYITNPPLSCVWQSTTAKQCQTCHTSAKAARRLTRALRDLASTFQPQTLVYCVVPVSPSAVSQRSSLDINNIETQPAINDIIASDKYQALWWDPQWVCLGFLLKQTPWALKNIMHAWH